MPKKKFVLRIDEKTMSAVEKWAADDLRSINGQLEWLITRALQQAGRKKNETPPELDSKPKDQGRS